MLTVLRYSGLCLLLTILFVTGIAKLSTNTAPFLVWIPLSADLAVLSVALMKDFLYRVLKALSEFSSKIFHALIDCLGLGQGEPQA